MPGPTDPGIDACSGQPIPELTHARVFGDDVVATAILDRLLHHSHVITIRGESHRLREKRRSGLFRGSSSILFSSAERTTGNQPKETP